MAKNFNHRQYPQPKPHTKIWGAMHLCHLNMYWSIALNLGYREQPFLVLNCSQVTQCSLSVCIYVHVYVFSPSISPR